ncbi:MAG: TRAP transporter large permease [Methylobacteriaceae bacterium]|jgi:tripartite ATP-independent transporter DctM subunit|nr:TRAP transporter large permease [Methylobacteriaceae bacterium]
MIVGLSCLILLVGLFINVPVFICVTAAILAYFFLTPDAMPVIAAQRFVGAAENTTLLAIPCFVFLGNLLNYTGLTRRLLKLAEVLTGHFKGGLAQTNVMVSTLMGGLSASNLADCAMLCKMLVPEMTKLGYSKAFSTAVTAAGSLITPIIPPGIALIIYGFVADVSIGDMFMAGVIPGILCCIALMITIRIIAGIRDYKPVREHGPSGRELWDAFVGALPALGLVVVIIGGIRIGVCTPTEAGAVAVAYAVIIGGFVYREMSLQNFKDAVLETAKATGGIMLIIMACSAFAWILTYERVAQDVAAFITQFTNPYVFLILLNVFLLILGMFVEGNAAIIVLVPLLKPTVLAMGIDPVQFGLIIILNLAIGCLTPPMGTVMFIANQVTGTKTGEFIREALPLIFALLVVLMLVTFVPAVSTFLPYALK